MKLLVLSPVFPDAPSDGDRLRLFHWLDHLGRRHEVTLACFADPARPADQGPSLLGSRLKAVERVPWPRWRKAAAAVGGLFSALPVNVTSAASPAFDGLVDRLLEPDPSGRTFDAVLAYRLKMAPYALRFKGRRYLDYTDCLTRYTERRAMQAALDGRGLARIALNWQAKKTAAFEAWVAGQFDGLIVNAATDASALRAMAPRSAAAIHVAANGVDARLRPAAAARLGARLLFVGHLAYPPNAEAVLWFAKEVFPKILAARPDATFEVVGGGQPSSVLDLAGHAGIRLHGFQADMRPHLDAATLSVCPVRTGAGRQNKLMEAFACGLPAVATGMAAAGAEAVAGRHLLTGDTPHEFSQAVLRILGDPALGRRLAKAALALAGEKYDWERNAKKVEAMLVQGS